MPATVDYQNRRSGCALAESAALNIVNEEIKLASGSGKCLPGTVLGQVSASKKFKPLAPGASDGTEKAAAVLFHPADATSADALTVATTNGPANLVEPYMTWPAGITAAQKATAFEQLAAKNLKRLPQHAG